MIINKDFEKMLDDMHFFDAEHREGYLVSKEMKKVWAVELDILREFIRVCEKYNLKYFVDSGTLLGAIRHGGFIPWDDDIDVVMLREDYDKLMMIAKNEISFPYRFQSPYHEENYHRNHSQIRNETTTAILKSEIGRYTFNQGIFVDIFPLDVLSDDICIQKKFYANSFIFNVYKRIKYGLFSDKYKFLKKISNIISPYIPERYVSFAAYEKYCGMYKKHTSGRMDYLTYSEGRKCKIHNLRAEWFTNAKKMKFEMLDVMVPVFYDNILVALYGNEYMIPVRSNSDHGDILFDTDKAYDEYI